ncbi:MAG: hypothetical protein IKJ94_06360 [Oscillospiraceae bacterium]|nr:hypothetical protein [Oscillospiraceae bacterium]
MSMKGVALSIGVGAAVGAVGILMMSKNNPTRKLASQAADKVEDAAWMVSDKISQKFDL